MYFRERTFVPSRRDTRTHVEGELYNYECITHLLKVEVKP